MAYTALVPPREWAPVGPTHWVRYEGNALEDQAPVRITVHPNPFRLNCPDLIRGLTVRVGPPELEEEDTREF